MAGAGSASLGIQPALKLVQHDQTRRLVHLKQPKNRDYEVRGRPSPGCRQGNAVRRAQRLADFQQAGGFLQIEPERTLKWSQAGLTLLFSELTELSRQFRFSLAPDTSQDQRADLGACQLLVEFAYEPGTRDALYRVRPGWLYPPRAREHWSKAQFALRQQIPHTPGHSIAALALAAMLHYWLSIGRQGSQMAK